MNFKKAILEHILKLRKGGNKSEQRKEALSNINRRFSLQKSLSYQLVSSLL